MATYELDELDADEIYHSLLGRKGDLDARVKSLSEKDGLPEAAEAVRKRIEIYMPHGEGDAARPGLLRIFAPQRDIEAERLASHAGEERSPDGEQDLFGGGAETGGGTPAGGKKLRKGKKVDKSEAEPTGETSSAPTDAVDIALGQLAQLAIQLLEQPSIMEPDIYRGYAVPVLDLIPKVNPAIDVDALKKQVNEEIQGQKDNAHSLAHFVQRNVDVIRDSRDHPIASAQNAEHGNEDSGISVMALTDSNATTGESPVAGADAQPAGDGTGPTAAATSSEPPDTPRRGGKKR